MKKLIYIIVVIVLLVIINGILHSIIDLSNKQSLLTSAQKELNAQKLKNAKLKGELSYAQTGQFIDETARNRLFLVKSGEEKVIISEDLVNTEKTVKQQPQAPNWQKWLKLFF